MPRPIWSGAISFGLVNVPVRMHTAVRKKTIRFNQLHAADNGRIQMRRVCSIDGEEVAYEDLKRGYELYPGQYVVLDDDEIDALDPQATHSVDIEDFVDLDRIDPLYFDTNYYLVPDERGAKAYRLLLDAMKESGRVGIARVVLRTKQYLCAVRPVGDALVLTTLNFADEVVPADELGGLPGPTEASPRELTMASQLIESLATDWDPARYRDTHRDQVMALIEAKAEGAPLAAASPSAPAAPVIDLMAALEASLAQSRAAAEPDEEADRSASAGKKAPARKAGAANKRRAG
ncbi:MAG TPA: Ku protein [Acidimicrobiales bacterium]|nr:Ku protein [Acidimicrobiales bacterium]